MSKPKSQNNKDEIITDLDDESKINGTKAHSFPANTKTSRSIIKATDSSSLKNGNEKYNERNRKKETSILTSPDRTLKPPSTTKKPRRPVSGKTTTNASSTTKEINGLADEEVSTGTRTPPDHTSRPSSGVNKTSRPTSAKTTSTLIDDDVKTSGTESPVVMNNEIVSRRTSKSNESSRPLSAKDNAADLLPADEKDTSKTSDTLNNMNEDQTKNQSDLGKENVTGTTSSSSGPHSRPSSGIEASKVTTEIETNDKIPGDSPPTGKLSPVNNVSSPVHKANKISRTSSPTDTKISDLNEEFEVKETRRQSSSDKITTSRPTSGSGSASRPTSAIKNTKEINGHVDEEVFTGTRTPPDHTSRPSSGINKTSRPTSAKTTTTQIDNDVKTSVTEGPIVVNNERVSRPTSKSKESSRPSSAKDNAADLFPGDETDTSKTSDTLNNMNEDQTKDQSDPGKENVTGTTSTSSGPHSRPSSGIEASKVTTAIETNDKIPGDSSPTGKLSPVNNVSSPVHEANKISRTSSPTDTKISDLNEEFEVKDTRRQSSSDKITTSRPTSDSGSASRPTSASKTTKEMNGHVDEEVFTGTRTPPDHTSRPLSGINKTSRPTSAKTTTTQIDNDVKTSVTEGPIVVNNETVSRPTLKSKESSRPSSAKDNAADLLPADETDTSKTSDTLNNMNEDQAKDQSDPGKENVTRTTSSSSGAHSRPSSGIEASKVTIAIETTDKIPGDSSPTGKLLPVNNVSSPVHEANKISRTSSPSNTKISDLNDEFEVKKTRRQSSSDKNKTSRPTSGSGSATRPTSASKTIKEINGHVDEVVFTGTRTPPNHTSRPSSGINKTSRPTSAKTTSTQIDNDVKTSGTEGPIVVNNETVSRPTSRSKESSRPSSVKDNAVDLLPTDEIDTSKTSDTLNNMNEDQTKDQSDPGKENVTGTTSSSSGPQSRPSSGIEASKVTTGIETNDKIPADSSPTGKLSPVNNVSSPVHEAYKISRTSSPTDTKISDLNEEFEVKETRRQSSSDKITTSRPTSGSGSASRPTSAIKNTKEINGHVDEEVFTGTRTPPDHTSRPSSGINKTSRPTSAKTTTTQIDNVVKTSVTEGPIVLNNETVSRPTSKSKESSRPSSAKDNAADLFPADETDTSKTSDTLNNMNEDQTKDQSDPGKENVTGTPSTSSDPHSRPSSGIEASKVTTAIETNDKIPGDSSPTGKLSPVNNVSSPNIKTNIRFRKRIQTNKCD
ncbi:mucin-5AC-like [Mytilus californianus]|uniref:mucin-5AC-like n=1 Tax=Mytilus californianus TaxID=6549 RepID=UPI002247A241|nr:mucin-5AC-like [Mytilus californianus]